MCNNKGGSPWFKRMEDVEEWLEEMEARRLEMVGGAIETPTTVWTLNDSFPLK